MLTDDLPLVDQHCHGVLNEDLDADGFAGWLTEAPVLPAGRDPFDSMVGLAVRRWCAPILGLPTHASPADYLTRRAELGWREVTLRLLEASGVTNWLVDTGFSPDNPLDSGTQHEIVRVEQVAENLVAQGESAHTLLDAIRAELRARAAHAVGLKTVVGYRCGLAVPALAPPDTAARVAVERWLRSGESRLTEPVLAFWLVHEAARVAAALGLPLQVHTGFGDPDLRLRDVDPALLHDFLASTVDGGPTVVLLHCWPYHRNAAYLAHVFGHVIVDIGLTLPFVGARAAEVFAETLELAPFDAVVYSSDGRALPETHYLAAVLWRHHIGRLLDTWIAADTIGADDAARLARNVGAGNATRVYQLT